ncbi:MAG: alkaline phytoceramidase [Alphaproteobacteria bacterium]
MEFRTRIAILLALSVAAILGVLFVPPFAQPLDYHDYADTRSCFAILNCRDVLSNIAFALVGVAGLGVLLRGTPDRRGDTLPYLLFFAGVLAISAGSVYYHWQPDNARLFWDRLPMTVGFMAFSSAIVTDRIDRAAGLKIVLPLLLVLGVASIVYWDWSERAGQGDLRFYGLVQFLPLALIPLLCRLFPDARHTHGRYIVWIYVWYGVGKIFELFDASVFEALGGQLSGHTLKHLTAALATACVIPMARAARDIPAFSRSRTPDP